MHARAAHVAMLAAPEVCIPPVVVPLAALYSFLALGLVCDWLVRCPPSRAFGGHAHGQMPQRMGGMQPTVSLHGMNVHDAMTLHCILLSSLQFYKTLVNLSYC